MELLSEYSECLEDKGYERESVEYFNGIPINVTFVDRQENLVKLGLKPTDVWEKKLNALLEKSEKVEIELNFEDYIVVNASFSSTITTERNFFTGNYGNIYLVKNPGCYHSHSLDYFEKCIELQQGDLVKHELNIMEAHVEHLRWAQRVLIPILKEADYTISYSSLFDVSEARDTSNLVIEFKHYNEFEHEFHFWMATDCLTGEIKFSEGLDLYKKSKEEIWQIMLDNIWKSKHDSNLEIIGRYTYLYRPGETKESYKEYLENYQI